MDVQKKSGGRGHGPVVKHVVDTMPGTTNLPHSAPSPALQALTPGVTGIQIVPEFDVLLVLLPA